MSTPRVGAAPTKVAVSRALTRLRPMPPEQPGWHYYTPDGHCIGPFNTQKEREDSIAAHYVEPRR